jgi:hypothetical protein
MTLEQRIDRLFKKMEGMELWFVRHVPDRNLPLINSKDFSESAKTLLEQRLKGKPYGKNLSGMRTKTRR